ncbi:MAG: hypothetical protein K8F36_00515 [Melioribacteraceae bacterium]|nr:hypothetical protein [Melioribacteraceae bacterium]
MANKWEELIKKEKQNSEEIKRLVEKHKISIGMLNVATNLGAPIVASYLRKQRISKKKYQVLKAGIEKILSNKISKNEIYTLAPRKTFKTVSSKKLKSLLKKNNLSVKTAAERANLNFDYLNSLLKQEKIPDRTFEKLLRRLKIR